MPGRLLGPSNSLDEVCDRLSNGRTYMGDGAEGGAGTGELVQGSTD